MLPRTGLYAVLDVVPPVEHAFGYGSGVFTQPLASSNETNVDEVQRGSGTEASVATPRPTTMVDFVFAVTSPKQWHAENIQRNPSHYAPHIRLLGPDAVVAIADRVGVGVHFNTLVPWRGVRDEDTTARLGPGRATHYKYGVVKLDTLCTDLTDWHSLFLAGRMQKPVLTISKHASVANALDTNLNAALATALLTLPDLFTDETLRETLCGLSYRGDLRTWFGAEDKHKVKRIAAGSTNAIDELYRLAVANAGASPAGLARIEVGGIGGVRGSGVVSGRATDLGRAHNFGKHESTTAWGQDKSESARRALCKWLPLSALRALGACVDDDLEQAVKRVASRNDIATRLTTHIDKTVLRSSFKQLLSGATATSPTKAVTYAAAKFAKSAASRFRQP